MLYFGRAGCRVLLYTGTWLFQTCPELEILSGSRSASWLPSLTAMEKNWHSRHTSGGCSPLVRLGKVGSSLETQSTLILVIHSTADYSLRTSVFRLFSQQSLGPVGTTALGSTLLSRQKCKDGNLAFMSQVPQGSGWGDITHFPSTKGLLPLFLIHRELSHQCALHSKLFSDHPGILQMTCQTPTLPASGPCFQPHHSFFGPSDLDY